MHNEGLSKEVLKNAKIAGSCLEVMPLRDLFSNLLSALMQTTITRTSCTNGIRKDLLDQMRTRFHQLLGINFHVISDYSIGVRYLVGPKMMLVG